MNTLKRYVLLTGCAFLAVSLFSCSKHDTPATPVVPKSSDKEIKGFNLIGHDGKTLYGSISGTSVNLVGLPGDTSTLYTPSIAVSDKATISPASGVPQYFSKPVTYTVTAEDGSKQIYTTRLTVLKSDQCQILSFAFNSLNPKPAVTINQSTGMIELTVPKGTDVSNLVPTIVISPKATITPDPALPRDFSTNPVLYQVAAEDGQHATRYGVFITFK